MHWSEFDKYKNAFKFIKENKPALIVEYGSGGSTIHLYNCLKELNYGGRLITYEDSEEYRNIIVKRYPPLKDVVKVVPVEYVDRKKGKLKYVHNYEEIKDVGLVIIDGPDYRVHLNDTGKPSNLTTNLEEINNYLNKHVPFFIDGRSGCVEYYEKLNYSNFIKQHWPVK